MEKKKIALIGATGSIGRSAIEVIRKYPQLFALDLLAGGSDWKGLTALAREFKPSCVAIADECAYRQMQTELSGSGIKTGCGFLGLREMLDECCAELCISAAAGTAGLRPTVMALDAGMDVALANKESLVSAGPLVMQLVKKYGCRILPLDSEHSAIMQCLSGSRDKTDISRIVITSSGGAARDIPLEQLATVTPEQALRHPNWSMGRKITIDSATLANKALEVMEAKWLFEMDYDNIDVLVHRQSIVHGMVEFSDGAVLAQLAVADMKLPISWALHYPLRLDCGTRRLGLQDMASLTFEAVDNRRYPMLELGYESGRRGGLYPAVYSAANEMAVELFLDKQIAFGDICPLVEKALEKAEPAELSLDNVYAAEAAARINIRENAAQRCSR